MSTASLDTVPPAEAMATLPKKLRDLHTEWVAARGRAGQASSTHAWLTRTAVDDDKHAAVADLAQAAANARAGGATGATPNADALAARRTAAHRDAVATAEAVLLIEADWREVASTHHDSGAPAKAIEDARAALTAAADALRAAVNTAAAAVALERWLSGAPYQTQATVDILDLAPVTRTTVGPAVFRIPPCDVLAAIDAIAHFTDTTPTH